MPEELSGLVWQRVLDLQELAENRVKAVTCQHRTICMTHFAGEFAALDHRCPHQGGPLGDGGFGQYMAEPATAVKYSVSNPNFAEYARLCGAFGIRVEQQENLDAALERALGHEGPSLVEVITDPDLL